MDLDLAVCKPSDANLFDVNPRASLATQERQAQKALALCARCRHTGINGACVKYVNPKPSRNSIVAGGVIFVNGEPRREPVPA